VYFEGKEDLLFTVADEEFARFGTQLLAAAAEADPLHRLHAIGRAYIAFGLDNPHYYALMFIDRGDFLLGYRAGERKPRLGALDVVERSVQEGIDVRQIKPGIARSYADALWASVHGIVALHIAMPPIDRERALNAAESVLEMMIGGLRWSVGALER
jgi:AcrR family transcriptional regulator